eukprot:PhM_4_TR11652/c1_g1_i1/m.16357
MEVEHPQRKSVINSLRRQGSTRTSAALGASGYSADGDGASTTQKSHTTSSTRALQRKYPQNTYSLTFRDPEVEARYKHYAYVESKFYSGKLFILAGIGCVPILYIFYHDDWGQTFHYQDIPSVVCLFISSICFVLAFLDSWANHREILYIVALGPTLVAFYYVQAYHRQPQRLSHGYILAVGFSATLSPGVRLCVQMWLVPLVAFSTLLIGSFINDTDYWDRVKWSEVLWWPLNFIPMIILYYLEVLARQAFSVIDDARTTLMGMQDRIDSLKNTVVRFFPKTITRDLLMRNHCTDVPKPSPQQNNGNDAQNPIRGVHFQAYPSSIIIVSDVAGFTSWTARTDNGIVIDVLSEMFFAFDDLAAKHHVEKVTTVGDSYVGVIFGNRNSSSTALPSRCMHAVKFALGILRILQLDHIQQQHGAVPLRQRVGVHIGDVVGGFVGFSPPRFDIFGEAVTLAKHMEATCLVGHVHITRPVMAILAKDINRWGMALDVDETAEGFIFSKWATAESMNESPIQVHSVGEDDFTLAQRDNPIDTRSVASTQIQINESDRIMHNLMLLTSHENTTNNESMDVSTRKLSVGVRFTEEANDDDEAAVLERHRLNYFTLLFRDSSVEKEYRRTIDIRDGEQQILVLFLILNLLIMTNQLVSGCLEQTADRVYLMSVPLSMIVLVSYITWWYHYQTRYRLHLQVACVFTCFLVPSVTSVFLSTDSCDESNLDLAEYRASNVIFAHGIMMMMSCQFLFRLPFLYKFGLLLFTLAMVYAEVALRKWVRNDDTLAYDPMIALGPLVYAIISYFTEHRLRSAFLAQQLISYSLRSTGRHAQDTKRALDFMLPSFVTDKMMRVFEKDAANSCAVRPIAAHRNEDDGDHPASVVDVEGSSSKYGVPSVASTAVSPTHNATTDFDDGGARQLLWDYPAVAVVFLSFTPPTAPATETTPSKSGYHRHTTAATMDAIASYFELVKPVLEDMERTMALNGVRKVKTVGTTMLCVAGLDDGSQGTDAVRCVINGVVCIVNEVLSNAFPRNADASPSEEDWSWSVGIHCGSCFGAVLGVQGLTFDVFGDTINTASRMQTTARKNSVQLSAQVAEWLGADVVDGVATTSKTTVLPTGCSLVALAPIRVKGKGTMNVYELTFESHELVSS